MPEQNAQKWRGLSEWLFRSHSDHGRCPSVCARRRPLWSLSAPDARSQHPANYQPHSQGESDGYYCGSFSCSGRLGVGILPSLLALPGEALSLRERLWPQGVVLSRALALTVRTPFNPTARKLGRGHICAGVAELADATGLESVLNYGFDSRLPYQKHFERETFACYIDCELT